MFILGNKPEIQIMTATIEEDQNIPNVRDEVDSTGGNGTSGGEISISKGGPTKFLTIIKCDAPRVFQYMSRFLIAIFIF